MKADKDRVCPVEFASGLEGKIRRWLHNPTRILTPLIKEGLTVLDVGCGPGFFSIEIARMVGPRGRVIAADLQDGMLELVQNKIRGTELEHRLKLVRCGKDKINVTDRVDLIVAFYMVHEVPDKVGLFKQFRDVLKPQGKVFLVEPKLFHVSRKEFQSTLKIAEDCGFRWHEGPKIRFSWSAILT
ncbi:MAG TPA: class I SAM-dependent methyltransferase [Bacteroidota bacterium]|nr:class I SAM-dependent methyltransferase [Bacteroidota bacterium]